ncbi:hypothetical protein OIDMADRAFT_34178 [Oidiodendron maius Zn]|uniref:Uncharacterized protein n=1 Tax=Oidiodendron maius (strain Zn) TaxID=913774 RepID=A0A0C3C931_OIDMZ|nr:hypothetical protein OIDMADRAFT_34178 [Oidiodendron maius Zn]
MNMFSKHGQRLVFTDDSEKLRIEPWSPNALRIRSTKQAEMPPEIWALQMEVSNQSEATPGIEKKQVVIINGKVKAVVSAFEYARNRSDLLDPTCSSLAIEARSLQLFLEMITD